MNKQGILYALVSAGLFGATTPFAKLSLGSVDPWLMAALLYLGSGLGLSAGMIVSAKTRIREAPLRRSDAPWMVAMIFSGGVLGPVLLMYGLHGTQASTAALLLNMEGPATMAIAWIVFREAVDRRLLLGALAIFGGAALLAWRSGSGGLDFGVLLVVGACAAWGLDNNLTRKVSRADPLQVAAVKGIAAGSTNFAVALLHGAALPPLNFIVGAMLLGLFGYGVSLVLFVLALRHLGAARTGAYFSTAPFIGVVVSFALFQAPFTVTFAVAAVLMSVGVLLHLTERHAHEHAHEAFEHEHRHYHDEHHRHRHVPADPDGAPHTHWHRHAPIVHAHPHYPDLHHRHPHP